MQIQNLHLSLPLKVQACTSMGKGANLHHLNTYLHPLNIGFVPLNFVTRMQ